MDAAATPPALGAREPDQMPVSTDEEDARALGMVKRWLPPIVTGGGVLVTVIAAAVMFSARLQAVERAVEELRREGSPQVRDLRMRLESLDAQTVVDRSERAKDHELLMKIDRKLSLLICKTDTSKCVE